MAGRLHGPHRHAEPSLDRAGIHTDPDARLLRFALLLIGCFLAAEVAVGLLARSLALLAYAGHMLTSGFPALSAHVLVDPAGDCHASRKVLEQLLADQFGISHTTLQVDHREDLLPLPTLRTDSWARPHTGHPDIRAGGCG